MCIRGIFMMFSFLRTWLFGTEAYDKLRDNLSPENMLMENRFCLSGIKVTVEHRALAKDLDGHGRLVLAHADTPGSRYSDILPVRHGQFVGQAGEDIPGAAGNPASAHVHRDARMVPFLSE
jgi:hypothetical protein